MNCTEILKGFISTKWHFSIPECATVSESQRGVWEWLLNEEFSYSGGFFKKNCCHSKITQDALFDRDFSAIGIWGDFRLSAI